MNRAPAHDVPPPTLPGYRFIEHIGVGGNAQVYLYEQDLPHRKVAVKVLNESALSETARRRFRAEANVTADLAHRHIVQVFEANVTPDGRPYLVMTYYPQPNLSVRARRAHFSVAEVLRIGIQVGSAVETSHRRQVLHRDIKPQNILTDAYGEPALTDFGIAGTAGDEGPEGLSVPWSPPEILYGTSNGDQRSDVYSLGATLWHLLVGRSPFEEPGGDNSTYALMRRIKSAPVPRTQRADVPDSLERLLRQAMAKELAARPQTAMELIHGLQSVEQELRLPLTQPILPAAAPPPAPPPEGDTRTRPPAPSGETTFSRGAGSLDPRSPTAPADPRTHPGQAPWDAGPRTHSSQAPWDAGPRTHPSQAPWDADQGPHSGPPPAIAGQGTAPAAARGAGGPWGPAETPAAGPDEQETRARGPVRLDPRGPAAPAAPAAPAEEQETRARGPVRLDPGSAGHPGAGHPGDGHPGAGYPASIHPAVIPSAAPPRSRHFPPEEPEAATLARTSGGRHGGGRHGGGRPGAARPAGQDPFGAAAPGPDPVLSAGPYGYQASPASGRADAGNIGAAVTGETTPRRRVIALAGGGVALVVIVAGAAFALTGNSGTPPSAPAGPAQATQAGGAQNALGAGATVPGSPRITARRPSNGSTQVLFTWTYDLHESGDTFPWQGKAGAVAGANGVAHKPRLLLTVPHGKTACIQVEVLRAKGGQSSTPATTCWPT